jgi:putative GTP pyrophosphokinase
MTGALTRRESRLVEALIATYKEHHDQIDLFRNQLLIALSSSVVLNKEVHSIRSRLKDANHLRDKLTRKLRELKQRRKAFDIRPDNLLTKINDLVGVRILHLYTRQIRTIDTVIR